MQVRLFIFLLIFVFSSKSHAYLTSDVDISLGFTSIDLQAGTSFVASLEEAIFEFNYNLNYSGPDISINLSFSEIIKDGFSNAAYTKLGLGLKWYFLGFNGEQIILGNSTKGLILRPTPFIGASGGVTNLSITSESSIGDFNTSNYEVMANAGLEVPITPSYLLITQVQGLFSVSSNSDVARNITYSGFSILAGIKISRF